MADLPSGTVTFLFTDIEGSMSLWDRDRAAMGTRRRAALRFFVAGDRALRGHPLHDGWRRGRAVVPAAPQALAAARCHLGGETRRWLGIDLEPPTTPRRR